MTHSALVPNNKDSRDDAQAFVARNRERYALSWARGRISRLTQPIDSETGTTTKSRNPYYISKQLQELVLTSDTGEQSTFGLTDFDATATQGDLVTVVSANPQGQAQPTPIALRNETTGATFFSTTEIITLVQPSWLSPKYFMPLVVVCILTVGALFSILFPCLLISGHLAKKRAAVFIEGFRFD